MSTLDEQGVAGLPDGAAAQVDVRRLRRQRRAELYAALRHSKTFLTGMAILIFWVASALGWRWIVRDPQAVDPAATLASPGAGHWFGTDNLGRDVLARVIAGAAPVLTVAPLATLLGIAGGATLGLVTGFALGRILPADTVTPEPLAGTVTWSNGETRKIAFVTDGDTGTRYYSVVGEYWIDANGSPHAGGYPSCLSGQQNNPVRTDRRRVELGVIYQTGSDHAPDIAVAVHCLD